MALKIRYNIEKMKENISIVDAAVRGDVDLHRKGANYFFCCPKHPETMGCMDENPSAYINRRENFFYCNSCGASGDMFDLVIGYNKYYNGRKVSFNEACEMILRDEDDSSDYVMSGKDKRKKELAEQEEDKFPFSDALLRFVGIAPESSRSYSGMICMDTSEARHKKNVQILSEEDGVAVCGLNPVQNGIRRLFYEDRESFWYIMVPKILDSLSYLEKNRDLIPQYLSVYKELCDMVCRIYEEKGKTSGNAKFLETAKKIKQRKEHMEYSNMFHVV